MLYYIQSFSEKHSETHCCHQNNQKHQLTALLEIQVQYKTMWVKFTELGKRVCNRLEVVGVSLVNISFINLLHALYALTRQKKLYIRLYYISRFLWKAISCKVVWNQIVLVIPNPGGQQSSLHHLLQQQEKCKLARKTWKSFLTPMFWSTSRLVRTSICLRNEVKHRKQHLEQQQKTNKWNETKQNKTKRNKT